MTTTRAPAWRYRLTSDGQVEGHIFQTDAELDALDPGWHDHPNKCRPHESAPAIESAPAGDAAERPRASPPSVPPPPSPAPSKKKNKLVSPGDIG